jgi:uncharacterized protein (UPF0212 family)
VYKNFCFECSCGHCFEDLVQVEQGSATTQVSTECPKCKLTASSVFVAPGLATYSLMSEEMRQDHLRKRSEKHTEKYLK